MTPAYADRRERFRSVLASKNQTGALLTDPSTITYLFGYISIVHTPWHPPSVFAVVPTEGSPVLCVPESEQSLTAKLSEAPRVALYRTPRHQYEMLLSEVNRLCPGPELGVEKPQMPVGMWEDFVSLFARRQLVDISQATAELRNLKDSWELEQVGKAAGLATHALNVALQSLAPGTPELSLKGRMDYECSIRAAGNSSDDIIETNFNVMCRPDLEALHDFARASKIPETGIAFVLSNVRVNGYWADTARTVLIGEPGPGASEALRSATNAQHSALHLVAPGVPTDDIVAAIDSVVAEAGFADRRRFRAIRGLGLETSELPREGQGRVLETGQLFCLQCYLVGKGFAVGRSDTILVTGSGHQCLTSA